MSRRKLLLNLFILKNPKFSIFYNYFDGFKSYSAPFFNAYIFNDEPVNYKKFLFMVISIPENKLGEMFFVASIKFKEVLVFEKIELANFLEELEFGIFSEDYENEYDEEVKDDILRKNIEKALKIIDNTLNNFSKKNILITSLKRDLHPKSILFSQFFQLDLYNRIKRS